MTRSPENQLCQRNIADRAGYFGQFPWPDASRGGKKAGTAWPG